MADWADKIASQWCERFTEENFKISEALRRAKADGMREAADSAATGNGRFMRRDQTDFEFGALAAQLYAQADKIEKGEP